MPPETLPQLPRAPAAVLDTNTVLDWLVFRDARVADLGVALDGRRLRWVACAPMREELERVLEYRSLSRWKPDSASTLASFDALAESQALPPPAPLNLRCSDMDDQVFLDLALAAGANWLLTHDRALLRLARRARLHGLEIVAPERWPGLPR